MNNFDQFKKYKWQELAKDYNSPLFRNYIWTAHPFRYPKLFGISRPVIGIVSERNRITYISDLTTWKKAHEDLVVKVKKDLMYIDRLIEKTNRLGERMNVWSERELYNKDLSKLSNVQLFKLYEKTSEWLAILYAHGVLLPLIDFGEHLFVEDNLKRILSEHVSGEEYSEYYRVFTEPSYDSFAQDQEIALTKLWKGFYKDKKCREAVANKSFEEVAEKFPAFHTKLLRHAEKWGWVYYVYAGPVFGAEQFFGFIKSSLDKGIAPDRFLNDLKERRLRNKKAKTLFIKTFKPDTFSKTLLALAGKLVWAKPRRKDFQSKTYFHSEKLMQEIGRRIGGFSVAEVRSVPPAFLREVLVENSQIEKRIAVSAFDMHVCLPCDDGRVEVFTGKDAVTFKDLYLQKEKEIITVGINEIKGSPACRGKAQGIVKIINVPDDMEKMNQGDVLVSTATTPSIVPAMKKAAAIISDEGGLTCHAAIVSRELGTPCVVGTKIATKVLKDGDMVEVDAEKGVVTIIKRG